MKDKDRTRLDTDCQLRELDEGKRTALFHAQTTRLASDRLIILPYAGRKHSKEFMKNPIVVPYHMRFNDSGEPVVIGNVTKTEFTEEGMFQHAKYAETDLAEQWWQLIRDGFVRMVSIAWAWDDVREVEPSKMINLLKKNNIKISDAELNELRGVVKEFRQKDLSNVAIGADPGALKRAADDGNEVADDLIMYQRYDEDNYRFDKESGLYVWDEHERGVIPFKKYPPAGIGTKWDGPAQIRKADISTLKKISTWFDSAKPDVKGSYKLPHHLASNLNTVWNGVRAAMGALLGARGGVKGLSASDRRGAYNHLSKHYKQFDKEPPKFREEPYTEEELQEYDLVVDVKRAVLRIEIDGELSANPTALFQKLAEELCREADQDIEIKFDMGSFHESVEFDVENKQGGFAFASREDFEEYVGKAMVKKLQEHGLISDEDDSTRVLDPSDPTEEETDEESSDEETENDMYDALLEFDPKHGKEEDEEEEIISDDLLDFAEKTITKKQEE